jgi:hypothetical protein
LKKLDAVLVCAVFCAGMQAQQAPVNLNSLVTFAVLGGSTVTSTGFTVVNGNLGLSPGSSVTGFPPGIVSPPYTTNINNSAAITAQADLTTAYNDAATPGRPGSAPVTQIGDLGGLGLPPGLYVSPSTMSVGVGETLTLNGNANSVWIFQVGSSITVLGSVVLTGGAQASNVFWAVNQSATLGSGSVMVGTIMAGASITLGTGATLAGRALAKAAVTMISNTIAQPGAPVVGGVAPALVVACPVSTANVNTPYNSSLLATGGTPAFTFSIASGSLPPGLTLNPATGAITGTPTTAGVDPFVAHAVDSLLVPASANCSITVVSAVSLTCPSSAATAGTPYSSSLVATGGTAPYTYSITVGALPTGLALNASSGAITGTPTTAGPDVFTAQALDLNVGKAIQSCSLTTAAVPPPTVPAPPSLSLVLIGLGCAALYRWRERIVRLAGRS